MLVPHWRAQPLERGLQRQLHDTSNPTGIPARVAARTAAAVAVAPVAAAFPTVAQRLDHLPQPGAIALTAVAAQQHRGKPRWLPTDCDRHQVDAVADVRTQLVVSAPWMERGLHEENIDAVDLNSCRSGAAGR